jgi:hypothetical protein
LTAGHQPVAGGASRRTRAVGQHQEGDGEGEQSDRLHQAPGYKQIRRWGTPLAGQPAAASAGNTDDASWAPGAPASGLDGGGCGLEVTLAAPLPPPFICCRRLGRLGQPGHAGHS